MSKMYEEVSFDDPRYGQLRRTMKEASEDAVRQLDYSEMMKAYNAMKVDSIIHFPHRLTYKSKLVERLALRGLKLAKDYTLTFADLEGVETAFLVKVSTSWASEYNSRGRKKRQMLP